MAAMPDVCDLGNRVDIYRIFPDHYEWVETYVENRLISDVWRQAMTRTGGLRVRNSGPGWRAGDIAEEAADAE